jgi:hypothetical protein
VAVDQACQNFQKERYALTNHTDIIALRQLESVDDPLAAHCVARQDEGTGGGTATVRVSAAPYSAEVCCATNKGKPPGAACSYPQVVW